VVRVVEVEEAAAVVVRGLLAITSTTASSIAVSGKKGDGGIKK